MKKYFKYLIVILLVSFTVPQIAFASWWNPFSWNIWNNIFNTFNKPQVVHIDSPIGSPNNSVITQNTSKNLETGQQKTKSKTENKIPPTIPTKLDLEGKKEETEKPSNQIIPSVKPEEIVKPQEQLTEEESLIIGFLSDPSLDNFRIFCNKAGNVQSKQTKEVLSGDKTTMITVNKTLFEVISSCRLLTDPNFGYIFVNSIDNLIVSLDSSDSDDVRIRKIRFNDQIKELNRGYKVYGYDIFLNSASTYLSVPNTTNTTKRNAMFIALAIKGIAIPEVEIMQLASAESLNIK